MDLRTRLQSGACPLRAPGFLALLALGATAPLGAAQSQFSFDATLTAVSQDDLGVFGDLVAGDLLSGSFSYDPSAPDFGGVELLGESLFPALAFDATVAGTAYSGLGPLIVVDDAGSCLDQFLAQGVSPEIASILCASLEQSGDALRISGTLPAPSGAGGNGTLALDLTYASTDAVTPGVLPAPESLSLSQFASATCTIRFAELVVGETTTDPLTGEPQAPVVGFSISTAEFVLTDLTLISSAQQTTPGLGVQVGQGVGVVGATLSLWNAAPASPLGVFVTGLGEVPISPLFTGVGGLTDGSGAWTSAPLDLPSTALAGLAVELRAATLDVGQQLAITNSTQLLLP